MQDITKYPVKWNTCTRTTNDVHAETIIDQTISELHSKLDDSNLA